MNYPSKKKIHYYLPIKHHKFQILEQLMTDIRRLSLQNLMAIRFFRGPSSAEGFEEVADQLEECKEALIHTLRGHCSGFYLYLFLFDFI